MVCLPEEKEVILGLAKVRDVFKSSKIGSIELHG